MEILSPAGNMEKLKTALYFGADAVYLAGKSFGLRAFAGNFTNEELAEAVKLTHESGKKIYVTVNIVAKNSDFEGLEEYLLFLNKIGVDAIIVSDIGIITLARKIVPNLDVHVSTQANVTNKYSNAFSTVVFIVPSGKACFASCNALSAFPSFENAYNNVSIYNATS